MLSVAAILVLTISLFVAGVLFITSETANRVLGSIQERVNVSIYFKSDVEENTILEVKKELESYSEVKSVDYVSKEMALETFKKNNANEPTIIQSLEEIGGNPLLASLVVRANDPGQYETIANYVAEASFKDDVRKVNFGKNKEVINKLNGIISEIKRIGTFLAVFFAAIAVLIIFNTIKVAIYTHRQEIEIMRLVGASNMYIRLPFIFNGIFYGIISAIISMALLFLAAKFGAPYVSKIIPSEDLVKFYFASIWIMFGLQAGIGAFLGISTSILAIRKYLKV